MEGGGRRGKESGRRGKESGRQWLALEWAVPYILSSPLNSGPCERNDSFISMQAEETSSRGNVASGKARGYMWLAAVTDHIGSRIMLIIGA